MRLGLFFVKNNMYYIKIVINNMSSKPRVPSDETIIKCRAIVEKADKSYLGIYGLPIPISVDIQKYIDRHIITANIEMLQKIKSELHLKIRSNGNGSGLSPLDGEILTAVERKLGSIDRSVDGGRSKSSKKRPTARRRRSSKARKSRKSRSTRRK
jgi:hypothetical protein